jgi:hypothetical protein
MMDGTTGADGSQAETTTQPQAGATQTAQAASAEPTASLDAAGLQRELAEARREAAKYRADAKRYADAQKAAEDAKLSETERLERMRSEVERDRQAVVRERQTIRLEREVGRIAAELGYIDPEDALVYLDRESIEWSEDGRPKGLERQLRELLARKPHLLDPSRTASPTRGVQASGKVGQDMNQMIRSASGRT